MTRSDAVDRYAIRGGMEGKKRLDLLARVLLPTTTELLNRVGHLCPLSALALEHAGEVSHRDG
jgi:hypothetical protein